MDKKNILNFLNENKKFILGPDGTENRAYYHCMQFDSSNKILKFNTDVDYKMNGKIEEVIKIICNKFKINKYFIEIIQYGEFGLDLDIFLDLNEFEKEKIVEIINFIKENFYDYKSWIIEEYNHL
jgi:hypothetical protein